MLRSCFADEIAIDFPSVGLAVERMRDGFLGDGDPDGVDAVVKTEVLLSSREAYFCGSLVPVDVPVRTLCPTCGGRGETWAEPCARCDGSGESIVHHLVRVALPRGVADGATFRFRVSSAHAPSVRVEVRVVVPR
jgi:hypothetical protein